MDAHDWSVFLSAIAVFMAITALLAFAGYKKGRRLAEEEKKQEAQKS